MVEMEETGRRVEAGTTMETDCYPAVLLLIVELLQLLQRKKPQPLANRMEEIAEMALVVELVAIVHWAVLFHCFAVDPLTSPFQLKITYK